MIQAPDLLSSLPAYLLVGDLRVMVFETEDGGLDVQAAVGTGKLERRLDLLSDLLMPQYDFADVEIRKVSRAEFEQGVVKGEWNEEDHPRDEDGRFGTGSGPEFGPTSIGVPFYERSAREQEDYGRKVLAIHAEAALQGFPNEKVDTSAEHKTFQLGDQQLSYAGAAILNEDRIIIYPDQLHNQVAIKGIVSHEIQHVKFETVMRARGEESQRMMADTRDVMRPDGTIRDGTRPADNGASYVKEYPLVSEFAPLLEGKAWESLVKDDGVSEYSEKWWNEWKAGKAGTWSAVHETIAEMARLKKTYGEEVPHTAAWEKLYITVNRIYNQQRGIVKVHKAEQSVISPTHYVYLDANFKLVDKKDAVLVKGLVEHSDGKIDTVFLSTAKDR